MKKTKKTKKTARGFNYREFQDSNGENCSIQKSSSAMEDKIWLGIDDPKPKICVQGEGWKEIPMPEGTSISGRMHLTREHVKLLLPVLKKFVDTGDID